MRNRISPLVGGKRGRRVTRSDGLMKTILALTTAPHTHAELMQITGSKPESQSACLDLLHSYEMIYIQSHRTEGYSRPPRVWAWQPSPGRFKDDVYVVSTSRKDRRKEDDQSLQSSQTATALLATAWLNPQD